MNNKRKRHPPCQVCFDEYDTGRLEKILVTLKSIDGFYNDNSRKCVLLRTIISKLDKLIKEHGFDYKEKALKEAGQKLIEELKPLPLTMEYQGYVGSVELSKEDSLLYGKVLGTRTLISYEGKTIDALVEDFHNAVDNYLAWGLGGKVIDKEKTDEET